MAAKPEKKVALDAKNLSANNYIAIVVALVMLAGAITALILYSMWGAIALNSKQIGFKNKAASQLKENIDSGGKLVDEFRTLGQKQDLIINALPGDSDFSQLVAISENIANSAGVRLLSVSPAIGGGLPVPVAAAQATAAAAPAAAPSSSEPQPYSFSIDVSGTYTDMGKLAANLELSARPMRVTDVLFRGESTSLKATFTIETYYQDKADISTKQQVLK